MKKAKFFLTAFIITAMLCGCGASMYSSSDFTKAPVIIYTTSAEENGYGDSNMFVEGTVGKPFEEKGQKVCEIVSSDGTIAMIAIPVLTSSSEWAKLKEGEWVRVNFQYMGYSDVLDKASGGLISVEKALSPPDSDSIVISGTPIVDEFEEEEDESAWASGFTPVNDFRYTLDKDNQTITLNKYRGDRKKVMISPIYNIDGVDYSMRSIGDGCFLGEISVISVYIPEGVTSISDNCFNSCSSLQYLYIPSTVESLSKAFFDYIHEYTAYCDSVAILPGERDFTDYEEIVDDTDSAGKLGESLAGAINGLVGGINSDPDNPIVTEIYFGGTESQWKSIRK